MSKEVKVLVIAFAILALYALGLLFPDTLWVFHYLKFLPSNIGWLIVFGGGAFIYWSLKKDRWSKWNENTKEGRDKLWLYGTPILFFMVMTQFPIFQDYYGDAPFMLPESGIVIEELDQSFIHKILDFNFMDPKLGTSTTFGLIGVMAYYTGWTVDQCFAVFDAFCGAAFIFFMFSIIRRLTNLKSNRVALSFLVLGAPFLQVFFGHIEVYGPVFLLLSIFWYLVVRYYQDPKLKWLLLILVLSILNLKFHVTGVVTLFVGLLVAGYHLYSKKSDSILNWKKIVVFAIVPIYFLGGVIYFMVTNSAFGSREFTETTLTDALFLPIKASDVAPLDRYNLFSSAHIFDFFSTFFLWSSGAVLILLSAFVVYRKRVEWKNPLVQFALFGILLYIPLFFVFNPLLSMQTDWDLMSIPGTTFIVAAVFVISTMKKVEKEQKPVSMSMISPLIVFFAISGAGILVNANPNSEGERLVSSGIYSYKTYWKGASSPILNGLNLLEDKTRKLELHHSVIESIRPYAHKGNDIEFAAILSELGNSYQNDKQDLQTAIKYYNEAFEYDSLLRVNVYRLVIGHFIMNDYESSNQHVPLLVAMQYPDQKKSLRIGIHVSLEANAYQAALQYCEKYLTIWADDSFIQKVRDRLLSEKDKSEIKFMFRQS